MLFHYIFRLLNNNFIKNKKIFEEKNFYKPFNYENMYIRWENHEKLHWLPSEISLNEDIYDWQKLDKDKKDIIGGIFKFFTQADVDVAGGYVIFLPLFPQPEVRMMMLGFASREAIHISAYSYLIETLGMNDDTYKDFLSIQSMREKQNYIKKFEPSHIHNYIYSKINNDILKKICFFIYFCVFTTLYYTFNQYQIFTIKFIILNIFLTFSSLLFIELFLRIVNHLLFKNLEHILCTIAMFSGFTEGVQLFSTFAILSEFTVNGLFKGMGQIISWSINDENHHIDGMINLMNTIREENNIMTKQIENKIYKIAKEMVYLEDKFIEHIFHNSDALFNLTESKLKQYIRYLTDKRLISMKFNPLYNVENPIKYIDNILSSASHTNFFENTPVEYSKGSVKNNWNEVF